MDTFYSVGCKGQLISKCLFSVFDSPKKQTWKVLIETLKIEISKNHEKTQYDKCGLSYFSRIRDFKYFEYLPKSKFKDLVTWCFWISLEISDIKV